MTSRSPSQAEERGSDSMRPMLHWQVLVSLGFLSTSGGLALVLPFAWATLFGLRTTDPQALAFARVAGARELILGIIAFLLWKRTPICVTTLIVGLSPLIGVADFIIVFGLRGLGALLNFAIHTGRLILPVTTWLSLRHSSRSE